MVVKIVNALEHYEKLIEENNDPVNDSEIMQEYMSRWDGPDFYYALGPCDGKRVFEIGVGTGRLAKNILEKGCQHFTGIDISPNTIERAKVNLSRYKNCDLLVENIESYQNQNYFDIAYSVLTFMHIEDKYAALKNIVTSVRKGGHIVLSISDEGEWLNYGNRRVRLYSMNIDEYIKCFEKFWSLYITH